MAQNTLVPKRRAGVSRTLPAPRGSGFERAGGLPPRPTPSHDALSETDALLRRSYALVERLHREVAARAAEMA